MLTPGNPAGQLMKLPPYGGKTTVAVGAFTATILVPGPGLKFYIPMITAASWLIGDYSVDTHTESQWVVTFANPAPSGGGEILWLLFYSD